MQNHLNNTLAPSPAQELASIGHLLRCAMQILQAADWPEELKPLTSEIWGAIWALESGIELALELPCCDPVLQ